MPGQSLPSRRLPWLLAIALLILTLALWLLRKPPEPIRIGVLHSLSGPMADSETPLVDAVRLAVEEINAAGGLLGRPVEMVVADGRSDPATFRQQAEDLLENRQVAALFGCWTSASRKAVKPVVERRLSLLFYPVQYEGLEQSPNIVYTGAAPNQQIIPGSRWAMQQFGKRVYLIGSDYIFPRAANRIIHDLVTGLDGRVVGERYLPLAGGDFDQVAADIRALRPDVVLNTVNGRSNRQLFQALLRAGLATQPVMSFSVSEAELQSVEADKLQRHYLTWNYFQAMPGAANQRFVAAFQQRFGRQRRISDPMESAYTAVRLWSQAVQEAGSPLPEAASLLLRQQSYHSPAGVASIEPDSRHLWQPVQIGRITAGGSVDIVHRFPYPIRPDPYPDMRPQHEWEAVLAALEARRP